MTCLIVSEHAAQRMAERLGSDSERLIRRLWAEGRKVKIAEMRAFQRSTFVKGYVYRVANHNHGQVLMVAVQYGLSVKVVTVIWRPLDRGEQ